MKLRSVRRCLLQSAIGQIDDPVYPLCGSRRSSVAFGFGDQRERDLFRAYIRINGVGPKMALALISSISLPTLVNAVQSNEVGVLTKVPG